MRYHPYVKYVVLADQRLLEHPGLREGLFIRGKHGKSRYVDKDNIVCYQSRSHCFAWIAFTYGTS